MTSGESARHTCCILLALLALGTSPALADTLRVGTAAININPPVGIPLAGYYSPRGSEGVLEDLYAKAVVLDDGQTRAAMIVCDLITVPRHTVLAARKQIEQQTKIPGGHVMISATHTHTGPAVDRKSARDELDGINVLVKKYTEELPAKIAQSVSEACQRLVPVQVSCARGQEDRLAFTRRFWMKDGTVGWNPGKNNPNIIRPVSPIDPEVGVVYFQTTDARPVLSYVNYAMHADTTGGLKCWPDFPGVLARRLAEVKGPEMMTMFANGACGNLNHINVQWSDRQHGPEEAIRLGTILAGDVLKIYMDLKPAAAGPLAVRSEVVSLPLAPVTEQEVAAAREIVKRGSQAKFLEQVQAYKALDVAARKGQPWEAEVQVMTLGPDLAWVALSGEVFVELGLSIKAASPFRQTHIVELANGSFSYIPNRSAYAEGNYEVISARCGEGSGEIMVEAAIRMLAELAPPADQAAAPQKIIEPPH
ncbi:MAG: hypothetical protein GX575_33945 [Candidatus Anammoximicrobium sp.]|nr:hypothetical protein [Candidatus Anammoximicrobium sp.]